MAAASGIYTLACGMHDVSIRRREAMAQNCPFAGNRRNQLEEHRDATVTGTPLTVKERATGRSTNRRPITATPNRWLSAAVRDRRPGPPKPPRAKPPESSGFVHYGFHVDREASAPRSR